MDLNVQQRFVWCLTIIRTQWNLEDRCNCLYLRRYQEISESQNRMCQWITGTANLSPWSNIVSAVSISIVKVSLEMIQAYKDEWWVLSFYFSLFCKHVLLLSIIPETNVPGSVDISIHPMIGTCSVFVELQTGLVTRFCFAVILRF